MTAGRVNVDVFVFGPIPLIQMFKGSVVAANDWFNTVHKTKQEAFIVFTN